MIFFTDFLSICVFSHLQNWYGMKKADLKTWLKPTLSRAIFCPFEAKERRGGDYEAFDERWKEEEGEGGKGGHAQSRPKSPISRTPTVMLANHRSIARKLIS